MKSGCHQWSHSSLNPGILFTNGLNDGWSAGGFLTDVDPASELLTLNMADGAHHSDLSHTMPGPDDTPDVTKARYSAPVSRDKYDNYGGATQLGYRDKYATSHKYSSITQV